MKISKLDFFSQCLRGLFATSTGWSEGSHLNPSVGMEAYSFAEAYAPILSLPKEKTQFQTLYHMWPWQTDKWASGRGEHRPRGHMGLGPAVGLRKELRENTKKESAGWDIHSPYEPEEAEAGLRPQF